MAGLVASGLGRSQSLTAHNLATCRARCEIKISHFFVKLNFSQIYVKIKISHCRHASLDLRRRMTAQFSATGEIFAAENFHFFEKWARGATSGTIPACYCILLL